MTNRSTIKDQLAARRAAAMPVRAGGSGSATGSGPRAVPSGRGPQPDILPDRTSLGQIKRAARSGKLDLASLELDRVHPDVYTQLAGIPADELSRPPTPPSPAEEEGEIKLAGAMSRVELEGGASRERAFGLRQGKEEWVEPEELVSMRLDGNRIREIELEIGAFGGLRTVDLSRNQLSSLPDSFADLLRLTSLNLSHNAFTDLPRAVLLLPKLEVLDLSHNAITALSYAEPIQPSDAGLGYGAGFLSTSFSRAKKASAILPALRHFNLSHNSLRALELVLLPGLRVLNLEQNALGKLDLQELKDKAPQLASLNLRGNAGLRMQGQEEMEIGGCKIDADPEAASGSTSAPVPARGGTTATDKPSSGPPAAIIKPSCTLVYKTCPAATFDSLPLAIDMDVYLPPSAPPTSAPLPVVIWFHGGGLLQGNKENLPPHFRRLPSFDFAGERCIVVSPNYRLAPQAPILDILGDMRDCVAYVRTRLAAQLGKAGHDGYAVDGSRICLSGGSAGGYLALMGSMRTDLGDEDAGGYKGEEGIRCCAPFYPITDLTHAFWATETNPVPWMGKSVPHEAARPHLNPRDPPICTAVSGGPRSILYPYMLQHALFPSLLFQAQRAVQSSARGGGSFRPSPETLGVVTRLKTHKGRWRLPPVYMAYGDLDDKVNPMEECVELLKEANGEEGVVVEVREGADHAFDEVDEEECVGFREWLGRTLF